MRPPVNDTVASSPAVAPRSEATLQTRFFLPLLCLLVALGLTRSWVSTSKDGLQIDEAWHAVAGISYARTGDFRLNPEHPPLVKLWVGATMPESTFRFPEFRPLLDKVGERQFIDDAFYVDNDPQAVQRQMRLSMLAFHGACLLALGFALRWVFGPVVALFGVGLLLLDPTVAAHLPTVLTDLPLTLCSAIAVVCSVRAFRTWRPQALVLTSCALGFTLASKHSAIPAGLFLGSYGLLAALLDSNASWKLRLRRLGLVFGVLLGAYVVLWAFYGFRYYESPSVALGTDTFNRPMADKIADLNSAAFRGILQLALDLHALPRAYLWGLADIIRAGVEGRQDVMYVFGKLVYGTTPWYFFPGVLLAKLPLGFIALTLGGAWLVARERVSSEWRAGVLLMLAWAGFYLFFIVRGNSGYAGVRHAAPIFPSLAVLAALPLTLALVERDRLVRAASAIGVLAIALSALPVMRPWEYYNELVGGADGAWQYFADDGLENGQRVKDIAAYYNAHLRGTNERAYDFYDLFENENEVYQLDFHAVEDDPMDSDVVEGTAFVNARWLGKRPEYDFAAFRDAKPVTRFGNVMVFRGRFQLPWLKVDRRLKAAYEALEPEHRDPERAETMFREVLELSPTDYQAPLELANLLLERGSVEAAGKAYALARDNAPKGDMLVRQLSSQIDTVARLGAEARPMRSPWLE